MARAKERQRARLQRAREALHDRVLAAGDGWTGWHRARLRANVVAGCAYAFTAGLVILAVWALTGWSNRLLGVLVAGFVAWFLWESRPRRLDLGDRRVLDPGDAVELRALLDEMSAALGVTGPRTITLDERLNASVVEGGRRYGRVLTLGVPLWLSLTPQGRVALLGHELGHFASGDTRRSRWVGGALRIINAWTVLLRGPSHDILRGMHGAGGVGDAGLDFLHLVSRGLMWAVGAIPYALGRFLLRVTYVDSRGAEYAADIRAARLAGRTATLEVLTALQRSAGLHVALQRAALTSGADLLVAAATYEMNPGTAVVPPAKDPGFLDSHPPMDLRLEVVRDLPEIDPDIRLDRERSDLMIAQLEPDMRAIERRIRDQYR